MKNQEPLELEEFQQRIVVRPLTKDDFDQLVAMQQACFPGMPTWTREHIESQLEHFPEGQICIVLDGELVASSGSLVVAFDEYEEWHDWRELADHGYIRNHDPEGDTLYGIEIMVHPDYRGLKLARRLYEARKELCRNLNLERIMIGGRIPGYGRVADEMNPREYAEQVAKGGLYDPVLTTQLANGFVLKRLIPDYLPADTESRGYATFCEWTNLDYRDPGLKRQRAVHNVRICTVQYQMREVESFEELARQVEFFVDTASDYQSDFVVLPELFTTQLLSFTKSRRPADAARALASFTERYLEFFTQLAIKFNVNVIGGSQFALEGDDLYNISYLFRRDGTIERQYKLHVTPAERRWWGVQPGKDISVFDTDRGKVSILVCYDIEFPELARIAVARGARILFVPFNTDDRNGYLRIRYCALARAVENQVYVVTSGCTGNLPQVVNADVHYAVSGIYTPADVSFARDGIAAECTPNVETLVIHDVDLEALRRSRRSGTVQNWNDRRKDLYQVIYKPKAPKEERQRI